MKDVAHDCPCCYCTIVANGARTDDDDVTSNPYLEAKLCENILGSNSLAYIVTNL